FLSHDLVFVFFRLHCSDAEEEFSLLFFAVHNDMTTIANIRFQKIPFLVGHHPRIVSVLIGTSIRDDSLRKEIANITGHLLLREKATGARLPLWRVSSLDADDVRNDTAPLGTDRQGPIEHVNTSDLLIS